MKVIPRWLLTLSTAAALTGVYLVYAASIRLYIRLPESTTAEQIREDHTNIERPQENVRIARTFLQAAPWAKEARYQPRTDRVFLYFNQWTPELDEGVIRFEPFAAVWTRPNDKTGEDEAFTVVSDWALVKFTGKFDLSNFNPGHINIAALEGDVQVQGPNGLAFKGKKFYFNEQAHLLQSDHRVRFTLGENSGKAVGVDIDLMPGDINPYPDLPNVQSVSRVRFRRDVELNLAMHQPQQVPLMVKLTCKGRFEYTLATHTATFDNEVYITREPKPKQFDWLNCDRLTVVMEPKPKPGAVPVPPGGQPTQIETDLQFRRLIAESFRPDKDVVLVSQEQDLKVLTSRFGYDAGDQLLTLASDRGVDVIQPKNNSRLFVPMIMVRLDNQQTASRQTPGASGSTDGLASSADFANRVKAIDCLGPGELETRDPVTQEVILAANWKKHLRQFPDSLLKLQVLELDEEASFRHRGLLGLSADMIRLWYRQPPPGSTRPSTAPASGLAGIAPEQFEPQRLLAIGQVALVSPQLEAEAKQRLELQFISDGSVTTGAVAPLRGMPRSRDRLQLTAQPINEDSARRPNARRMGTTRGTAAGTNVAKSRNNSSTAPAAWPGGWSTPESTPRVAAAPNRPSTRSTSPAQSDNPLAGVGSGKSSSTPSKNVPNRAPLRQGMASIGPDLAADSDHEDQSSAPADSTSNREDGDRGKIKLTAGTGREPLATNRLEGRLPRLASTDNAVQITGVEEPDPPIEVNANSIFVRLKLNSADPSATDAPPDVREILTEGEVYIRQRHLDDTEPLEVRCTKLHLQRESEQRGIIHVLGQPARITDRGMRLEGPHLQLREADNRIDVTGKGELSFPVAAGLDGKKLDTPQQLTVQWLERMVFDGLMAHFEADVLATMADDKSQSRMKCQTMQVTLDQRINFAQVQSPAGGTSRTAPGTPAGKTFGTAAPKSTPKPTVILCQDGVEVEHLVFEQSQLQQIQTARVFEFQVDQVTGKTTAQGPGKMEFWQRGAPKQKGLATDASMQANRPKQLQATDWDYHQISFKRKMDGNVNRRTSTFTGRVHILYGPVAKPRDVFNEESMPDGAGALHCEVLEVTQVPSGGSDGQQTVELKGHTDAWLDGRIDNRAFHAKANQISYDGAKGIFTLRATGKDNKAEIWLYNSATDSRPSAYTPAQRIEFFPVQWHVKVHNVAGGASGNR